MDPEDEDKPYIAIGMHAVTQDTGAAARAIETFSRVMLGLTLDGLDITMSSSTFYRGDDDDEGGEDDEDTDFIFPSGGESMGD